MKKKWVMEDDIVQVEENNVSKYYFVDRLEDFVIDYRSYGTVATGTLGASDVMTDLEPKQVAEPERRMYQVHTGIDVGMAYAEILAGAVRRGTDVVVKPTSTNYYVGYFDETTSPIQYPTFEYYLFYTEKPAFAIYNKWGFTITPYLSHRGLKARLYDLEHPEAKNYLPLSQDDIKELLQKVRKGVIPHRRITKRGLEA